MDEEGKANDEKRRKVAILGGRRRIKKNRKSVGGREVKKSDDDVELPEYLLDDLLLACSLNHPNPLSLSSFPSLDILR
ncbi:hypothetical protein ADUPG1_002907, partial [Aduncisulcus paluster]